MVALASAPAMGEEVQLDCKQSGTTLTCELPSDVTGVTFDVRRGLTKEDPSFEEGMVEALLVSLQARFTSNMERHEGVEWAAIQRSLEANPEAILSLQQMEIKGHEPDVYMEDDDAYYFGTCSAETPESARNILYDAEVEAWFAQHYPTLPVEGNAVDMAAAMGIDLMDVQQYGRLQEIGGFDGATWSWLKTVDELRVKGRASNAGPYYKKGLGVIADEVAYSRDPRRGFRGSLRVPKI